MRRGFNRVETVVAAAISNAVLAAIFSIFWMAARVDEEETARQDLRIDAVRSLEEIVRVLGSSGPADIDCFPEGSASADHPYLGHPAPSHKAIPGDDDFGPTVEMAFKGPQHPDGSVVSTNAAGEGEGSPDTHAFVLLPTQGFGNEVHLRTHDAAGALRRSLPIARHVERLLFETNDTNPALGRNQLRVVLWFRRPGPRGMPLMHKAVGTLNLRSPEEQP